MPPSNGAFVLFPVADISKPLYASSVNKYLTRPLFSCVLSVNSCLSINIAHRKTPSLLFAGFRSGFFPPTLMLVKSSFKFFADVLPTLPIKAEAAYFCRELSLYPSVSSQLIFISVLSPIVPIKRPYPCAAPPKPFI